MKMRKLLFALLALVMALALVPAIAGTARADGPILIGGSLMPVNAAEALNSVSEAAGCSYTLPQPDPVTITPNTEDMTVTANVTELTLGTDTNGKTATFLRVISITAS